MPTQYSQEVTDPELLSILNEGSEPVQPQQQPEQSQVEEGEVTDPELLAQLEGVEPAPQVPTGIDEDLLERQRNMIRTESVPTSMDYARSQRYGVLNQLGQAFDRTYDDIRAGLSKIPGVDMQQNARQLAMSKGEVFDPFNIRDKQPEPTGDAVQYRPDDDRLNDDGTINVNSPLWEGFTPQQIFVKAEELKRMPKRPSMVEVAKAYEPDLATAFEGYNMDGSIDLSHERWKDMPREAMSDIVAKDLEYRDREDVKKFKAYKDKADQVIDGSQQAQESTSFKDAMSKLLASVDPEAGFGTVVPVEPVDHSIQNIPKTFDLPNTSLSQYAAQEAAYGEGADDYVKLAQEEADRRNAQRIKDGEVPDVTVDDIRKENLADAAELAVTSALSAATGGIGAGSGLLSRIASQASINAAIDAAAGVGGNWIADRDLDEGLITDAVLGGVGGTLGGILSPAKETSKARKVTNVAKLYKEGEEGAVQLTKKASDLRDTEQLIDDLNKKLPYDKMSFRGQRAFRELSKQMTGVPAAITSGEQLNTLNKRLMKDVNDYSKRFADDYMSMATKQKDILTDNINTTMKTTDLANPLMKIIDRPGGVMSTDLSYAPDSLNKALERGEISQLLSTVGTLAEKASFGLPAKVRGHLFKNIEEESKDAIVNSVSNRIKDEQLKLSGDIATKERKFITNTIKDLESLRSKVAAGKQLTDSEFMTYSKVASDSLAAPEVTLSHIKNTLKNISLDMETTTDPIVMKRLRTQERWYKDVQKRTQEFNAKIMKGEQVNLHDLPQPMKGDKGMKDTYEMMKRNLVEQQKYRKDLQDFMDVHRYYGTGDKFKSDTDISMASGLGHMLTGGTFILPQLKAIGLKNLSELPDKLKVKAAMDSLRDFERGAKPSGFNRFKKDEIPLSLEDFIQAQYGRSDANVLARNIINNYLKNEGQLSDAIDGYEKPMSNAEQLGLVAGEFAIRKGLGAALVGGTALGRALLRLRNSRKLAKEAAAGGELVDDAIDEVTDDVIDHVVE